MLKSIRELFLYVHKIVRCKDCATSGESSLLLANDDFRINTSCFLFPFQLRHKWNLTLSTYCLCTGLHFVLGKGMQN